MTRAAGLVLGRTMAGLGALGLWLVAAPGSLRADGGTLRVANLPMGAYRVNVFTDPTPIPPDSIDVSVLVTFERGRGVAMGLDIEVVARRVDGRGVRVQASRHPGAGRRTPGTMRPSSPWDRWGSGRFESGSRGPRERGKPSSRWRSRSRDPWETPSSSWAWHFSPCSWWGGG